MKKLIFLLFLLIPSVCFGALASTTVWEVRTTGTATNGGGFNSAQDAVNGVDYSQQDAAQLTLTDGATSGIGVTTFTSATGGFTHAMEGNIIYISAGTNALVGYYEIVTYTDTNTVELDRAPDDGVGAVSGANFKVGGAVDHPYRVDGHIITDNTVKMWVKKGTYIHIAEGNKVLNARYIHSIEGYNLTRGDNPTVKADMPQFDGDNTAAYGIYAYNGSIINCVAYNNTDSGIYMYECGSIINCVAYNNDYGIYCEDPTSVINCVAYSNTYGIYAYNGSIINCVAYNNDYGIYLNAGTLAINCIAYNNTTYGFYAYGDYNDSNSLMNCIAYNNIGTGFFADSSYKPYYFDYNCYYDNTSADLDGITAGTHDVNADPLLVDPANGDFTLRAGSPCLSAGLSAIAGLTSDFNINIGVDQNDHGTAPHTTLRNCTIRNGTIR